MLGKGANLGVQDESTKPLKNTSRNERGVEPRGKTDLRGEQCLGD